MERAAKRQDADLLHQLQEQGLLDSVDDGGDTALHRLIKSDELGAVEWLLLDKDIEVDVNIQDGKGKTLLHLAVEKDKVELSEILCMRYPRFDLEDYNGQTVVSYVTSFEKSDALFRRVYLEYARLFVKPYVDLLEKTAKQRDSKTLRKLQDRMSLDVIDDARNTIFHRLIKNDDIDTVVWILSTENLDFDVNGQNREGKTILHLAVERSNIALIDAILRWNPRLDVQDTEGKTVSSYVSSLGTNSKVYQRIYIDDDDISSMEEGLQENVYIED